jgi:hypothetical protein
MKFKYIIPVLLTAVITLGLGYWAHILHKPFAFKLINIGFIIGAIGIFMLFIRLLTHQKSNGQPSS